MTGVKVPVKSNPHHCRGYTLWWYWQYLLEYQRAIALSLQNLACWGCEEGFFLIRIFDFVDVTAVLCFLLAFTDFIPFGRSQGIMSAKS